MSCVSGPAGDEVVAQRIGVVALEEVADEDRVAAARRELLALHRQVLRRDDVAGQLELGTPVAVVASLAVAEQHRRPDHGVEDDVVLALEVVVLGVRVLPPLPPRVGIAGRGGPLDRRREVADHGVEPDVDPLVLVLGVAGNRDADAPVEIARDRARADLVEQAEREVLDVRPPVVVRFDPAPQPVGELRQIQEQVLRLAELRHRPVDPRARIDQVGRVELVAAVVALVAARLGKAADRAGALDVAVRERVPGRRRERDEHLPLDDRAVLVQRPEQILGDPLVVERRRAREQVVGEPRRRKSSRNDSL